MGLGLTGAEGSRGIGQPVEIAVGKRPVSCKADSVINVTQAVKTLVRKGSAVGVAYREVVADEIREGEFRALRLKKRNLTVESYLIYSNQSPLSPPAQNFWDLLKKHRDRGRAVR